MEIAMKYTKKEVHIKWMNSWRFYFQAVTLADLSDGHERKFLLSYRDYDESMKHTQYRTSKLNQPKQEQPNKTTFQVLVKFLQQTMGMQQSGTKKDQLGNWIQKPSTSDNIWNIYNGRHRNRVSLQKEHVPV